MSRSCGNLSDLLCLLLCSQINLKTDTVSSLSHLSVATLAPMSRLLGRTLEDAALIDQWVHLAESEVDVPVAYINLMVNGKIPYSKPVCVSYPKLFVSSTDT